MGVSLPAYPRRQTEVPTEENVGYQKYGTFKTSTGGQAGLNPRKRKGIEAYNPVTGRRLTPSSDLSPTPAPSGFTMNMPSFSGVGGAGGVPGTGAAESLTLEAKPSPEMQEATRRFEEQADWLRRQAETTDANLQEQIRLYRERMGEGPTTRAIERASSAIRDFAAGQAAEAMQGASAAGRSAGFGGAGISDAAKRAQAGAAADISLGREAQLDQLLATGTPIMAAPGQRELAYAGLGSQFYGLAPYGEAAGLGLAEKELGLRAYQVPRQLAIEEMGARAAAQGSPLQWYQMLFG
jgi:hypothetical protein